MINTKQFNKSDFIFFWGGIYSQWYPSQMTIDNITFNTAEQYMMYKKALVFKDTDAAFAILNTDDPQKQKSIGRRIRHYNDTIWMQSAYKIVVNGNLNKFQQNEYLKIKLLGTGNKQIVEASPTDKRWGIGLSEDDPKIYNPDNWKGENLLGKAIMEVRSILRNS